MLRPTDDLRIERLRPLIPPAILMEQYAITDEASTTIAEGREAINRLLRDEDDRLLVVAGPCSIHDVEAARDYATRLRAAADRFADRPPARHARLLREAADDRRVEGADQRPQARRELRDQRRAGPGAGTSARPRQDGAAGGVRVPRHHHAPVHRRPGVVGRDRRPDHREPGPPRAGLGSLDAGRVQERHRRQRPDRRRRDPGGHASAPVPLGDEAGAGRHRGHARQRRLSRDPPWRPPAAELPRRGRGADREGADAGRPAARESWSTARTGTAARTTPASPPWPGTSPPRSPTASATSSG